VKRPRDPLRRSACGNPRSTARSSTRTKLPSCWFTSRLLARADHPLITQKSWPRAIQTLKLSSARDEMKKPATLCALLLGMLDKATHARRQPPRGPLSDSHLPDVQLGRRGITELMRGMGLCPKDTPAAGRKEVELRPRKRLGGNFLPNSEPPGPKWWYPSAEARAARTSLEIELARAHAFWKPQSRPLPRGTGSRTPAQKARTSAMAHALNAPSSATWSILWRSARDRAVSPRRFVA